MPEYPSQRQHPILKEVPKSPGTKRATPMRIRILRVWEYELIRKAATSLENQTKLDGLLLPGMRYVEARRFHDHRDWLQGRVIHLPSSAMKKARRTQLERWVKLSDRGAAVVPYFLKGDNLPSWDAWHDDLIRWALRAGLNPAGLSPKTTRKTWESWLVYYSPDRLMEIMLSQGHTEATSFRHYLGLPFTKEDREEMRPWVEGWG